MNIPKQIAGELQIREEQVISTAALFAEDATVPFIARYRKEKTGGLDEDQLRDVEDKLNYYELLQDRKETILKIWFSIEKVDKKKEKSKLLEKIFF